MVFLIGAVGNPHQAEDLLQEVWVRLAGAIRKGEVINNHQAWCRQTARYLVLNHWRKTKRCPELPQAEISGFLERIDEATSPAEQPDDPWQEKMIYLRDCLNHLKSQARQVLQLRYFDGLSAVAIGRQLGLSSEGVAKSVYRSRRQLATCVEKRMKLEEALGKG